MDRQLGVESQALVKSIMVEVTLDPSSKELKATISDQEKTKIPEMAAAMKTEGGQLGGKSRRNKKSKKGGKSRKAKKSLRRK